MSLVETLPAFPFVVPKIPQQAWPVEREERLRVLWFEIPQLSCSEIGGLMGLTRNAIIGKANRLGLDARAKGKPRATRPPRRQDLPLLGKATAPSLPKSTGPIQDYTMIGLPLMRVERGRCFDVIETETNLRCGHLTGDPEKSFCPAHHAIYYTPYSRRAA